MQNFSVYHMRNFLNFPKMVLLFIITLFYYIGVIVKKLYYTILSISIKRTLDTCPSRLRYINSVQNGMSPARQNPFHHQQWLRNCEKLGRFWTYLTFTKLWRVGLGVHIDFVHCREGRGALCSVSAAEESSQCTLRTFNFHQHNLPAPLPPKTTNIWRQLTFTSTSLNSPFWWIRVLYTFVCSGAVW